MLKTKKNINLKVFLKNIIISNTLNYIYFNVKSKLLIF